MHVESDDDIYRYASSDPSFRKRSTTISRIDDAMTSMKDAARQQTSIIYNGRGCCDCGFWKKWMKTQNRRQKLLRIQIIQVVILGTILIVLLVTRLRMSFTTGSIYPQQRDSTSDHLRPAGTAVSNNDNESLSADTMLAGKYHQTTDKKKVGASKSRVRKAKNGKLLPTTSKQPSTSMNDKDHPKLQLPTVSIMEQEFPTLLAFRKRYDIVGLYFAASWCPMSTPTTKLLDETFRSLLLNNQQQQNHRKANFGIIYISSDETFESFQSYLQPGWNCIPYHNVEERCKIKQFFHTCAKREMEHLRIDERWYEIPSMIVLGTSAHNVNVITYHGIQEIQKYGNSKDVVQHWISSFNASTTISTLYN